MEVLALVDEHHYSHYEINNITKQDIPKIPRFIKFFVININKK